MIIGIGCDVVEISRIEKLIEKETAIKKLFSQKEREIFAKQSNKAQWAAGRFAAKEAASKALKVGIAKCPLNCVEVLYDKNGAPTLSFLGNAENLLDGINYIAHISITHDAGIAQAIVIIEEAEPEVKIRDTKAAKEIAQLLPKRDENVHKGDMGKVAILAGSKKYSGAGYLCTLGALKAGAGLVTWCRNYKPLETPPEAMSFKLPKKHPMKAFVELCKDKDAVVIGPGLGVDFARKVVSKAVEKIVCTTVLDADALNAISEKKELPKLGANIVITPHIGEAARLLKKDNDFVSKNTVECAKELCRKTGAVTVIKCHETIVCAPNGEVFINSTGNAGMASGGSGDVLSGLIGALLKRLEPFDAARYAVYLHGLAGDIAKLNMGENAMTATDIVNSISKAFITLEKYR